jgi:caa(3)-type oxidase subunit IV
MAASAEHIKKHVKHYWMVFGALALLTVVTVGASYLSLPVALGIAVALAIAATKGSLVAAVFMHLIYDRNAVITGVLLLCGLFFLVLLLIPMLTEADNIGELYVH